MVSQNMPFEYFELDRVRAVGPFFAVVDGKPVSAYVTDAKGRRFQFVGLLNRDRNGRIDILSLRTNEWFVAPNLIYRAA